VVKIGGFSKCKAVGPNPFKEKVGLPENMSPEMLVESKSSKKGYGKEHDIWCLGILLFSMVYGHHPF
jgi:serine/threonine protein kinase